MTNVEDSGLGASPRAIAAKDDQRDSVSLITERPPTTVRRTRVL